MGGSRRVARLSFAIAGSVRLAVGMAVGLSLGTAAAAQETVTYTYDALGRVVASSHAGSVNSGLQQQYSYDNADNRTNVMVSGSALTGGARVIVVPRKAHRHPAWIRQLSEGTTAQLLSARKV